mgnify:CR=1 FL=1
MIVKTTTRRDGAISSSYTERVSQNLDKAQPNERAGDAYSFVSYNVKLKKRAGDAALNGKDITYTFCHGLSVYKSQSQE